MGFALRGIVLVLADRRLWPYVWLPFVLAAALYLALLFGGYILFVPRLESLLSYIGIDSIAGFAMAAALYAVVWALLSGLIFLSLAGLLSSLLWDRLSTKVEALNGGKLSDARVGCLRLAADTILRAIFAVFMTLAAFLGGIVTFGAVAILFAAMLGLCDYTAPAMLRRGVTFPDQAGRVLQLRGWLGFAIVSGVLTLVPFVNVLAMPGLVAGGTLMVLESEARRR